ncbi:MAG: hypothetical protein J6Y69_03655, partial [Treponema sp.]|nr:hypothetical protein [Treponema sp.]
MSFFLVLSGCDSTVNNGSSGNQGGLENTENQGNNGNNGNQQNTSADAVIAEINADSSLVDKIEIIKNNDCSYSLRTPYLIDYVCESSDRQPLSDFSDLAPDSSSSSLSGCVDLIKLYNKLKTNVTVAATASEREEISQTQDYRAIVQQNEAILSRLRTLLEDNSERLGESVCSNILSELNSARTEPDIKVTKRYEFSSNGSGITIYMMISYLDSTVLPQVNASNTDAEIIPGVKRILRNNRKAIDFTGSNADIKIDCSPKEEETSINISDYYKGGILYTSNETVSLINDNGNFVCRINKEDFKNTDDKKSVLMDIIKAGNANFSQLTIRSSDNNLYGIIK